MGRHVLVSGDRQPPDKTGKRLLGVHDSGCDVLSLFCLLDWADRGEKACDLGCDRDDNYPKQDWMITSDQC